jgi:hypothetical protein
MAETLEAIHRYPWIFAYLVVMIALLIAVVGALLSTFVVSAIAAVRKR